jgi:hypothetical protein
LSFSGLRSVVGEAVHEDEERKGVPDQEPRLREVEVARDRGDEPEHDAEQEQSAADRREPVLGRQDPTDGANVSRACDGTGQHPLTDEDRDRHEHHAMCRNLQTVDASILP